MILSKLFNRKNENTHGSRVYLKSESNLKLLPSQVVYVEGMYNGVTNRIISDKLSDISSRLKDSALSADFIYLPSISIQMLTGERQYFSAVLLEVLNYYYPRMGIHRYYSREPISRLPRPQTDSISSRLFSALSYKEDINPGFLRYMGQDGEGLFVYEYFYFTSNRKSEITEQIYNYIETIAPDPQYSVNEPEKGEDVLLGSEFNIETDFLENRMEFLQESKSPESVPTPKFFKGSFALILPSKDIAKESSESEFLKESISRKKINKPAAAAYTPPAYSQHELINRIKLDIQNLKELGFYEILLKEIGGVLYGNDIDRIFQPSRLYINDDFNIFLPDFNNMEIEMTPLPKSLFILFLRHPDGINLKTLIDYKIELLEIYKLLSYRETYFSMVESVDRICNPFEGSINEKLSRIKEAFLKKISMDTAKYYIVSGERGMKKKIELDRSLVLFPDALSEIKLTAAQPEGV